MWKTPKTGSEGILAMWKKQMAERPGVVSFGVKHRDNEKWCEPVDVARRSLHLP